MKYDDDEYIFSRKFAIDATIVVAIINFLLIFVACLIRWIILKLQN